MEMIKINELLKTIKAHRKEAEFTNKSNLIKQELDKGILDRTKKIPLEKTRYFEVSFSEVIKDDYLPIIIKKRKELEELSEKFLKEEQENVLSSHG